MPLELAMYQQVTIHEASHIAVAIDKGFRVFAAMFDGPNDHPGAIWRAFPEGKSAETDRDWARRELAVFAAGYLGEKEFYNGDNEPTFVEGPDGDKGTIDYLAFQTLELPDDIATVQATLNAGFVPRQRWRAEMTGLAWHRYDHLIGQVEAEVRDFLHAHREPVQRIARELLAQGHIRGRRLYELMGVPWIGQERTVAWVDFPAP